VKQKTIDILNALRFPMVFIVTLWVIHTVSFILGIHLGYLGVLPREWSGLIGIITAPLIHGEWQHLISNTVPLAALCAVLFLFFRRVAVKSFLLIYLLSGIGVWLFARPHTHHIGASGVVYGLISFVFWSGVFRRNVRSIVLALIMLVMYSGYFPGIVPGEEGVSWESHLLGAIVGILIAWLFKERIEEDEVVQPVKESPEPERYFLPRDVFEKTMAEREAEEGLRGL
jgi:membrane associated rhomboid family serine protease